MGRNVAKETGTPYDDEIGAYEVWSYEGKLENVAKMIKTEETLNIEDYASESDLGNEIEIENS